MPTAPADLYMAAGWLWRDADLYRWVERYSATNFIPFEVVPGTERSQVLVLRFPEKADLRQFLSAANLLFPTVEFV